MCTVLFWSVNTFAQDEDNSTMDYKKNAFELDLVLTSPVKEWSPGFNVGIGWLHNFSRYFGWDIIRMTVGNSFEKFDIEKTGFTLWTGPKAYYPLNNGMSPFLAFRFGYGGVSIEQIGDGLEGASINIQPEIGINLSRSFYVAAGYGHSWSKTTIKGTKTESYIKGYDKVYLPSTKKYMDVPQYGTRTVSTSTTVKNSIGSLYLRLGFNF